MAVVVWQYANPYADLTGSASRNFVIDGQRLTIQQDTARLISLNSNTGCRVWDGAYVLARFLSSEGGEGCLRGRRIVELGSGTGLAGLAAWVLGADAMLTDLPECLELPTRNAEANAAMVARSGRAVGQLTVCGLPWGTVIPRPHWRWPGPPNAASSGEPHAEPSPTPEPMCGPFDVILGADVTYLADTLPALMHTIDALSGPTTVVYLTHKPRGLVDNVLMDALQTHGFRVEVNRTVGQDVGYVLFTLTPEAASPEPP